MVADPDFLAETKKADVPVAPMSGEDMLAYVTKVMSTPTSQLESARALHKQLVPGK